MSGELIKIVPADFEHAYSEIVSLKESLSEYRTTVKTSYYAMRAQWSGAAADSFDEYSTELFDDLDLLIDKMQQIADNIKQAQSVMQKQDREIAKLMKGTGDAGESKSVKRKTP